MSIEDFRALYVVSCFVLCFIIALPTITTVVSLPAGEPFSELWLLGVGHMAEGYPFNVSVNTKYNVYVGIGNHLGYYAYYLVYVKFRNQTEVLPNSTSGIASPLPPLFEYRFFLAKNETWEALLKFSFTDVFGIENHCRVETIEINDRAFIVEKSAIWDSVYDGFYYQLFFELWLYDTASQEFQFCKRFVGIWLNMTI